MKSKRNVILREKAEPVEVRVEEELENAVEEAVDETVEEPVEETVEEETVVEEVPAPEAIKPKPIPAKKHSIEKEKSKRIRSIIAELLIMLLLGGAVLGAMIKISAPPEENKNIDKTMIHVVGMGNVWLRRGEDWVYLKADRTYATDWVQIPPTEGSPNDKEWCYFDENGIYVNCYNEKDEPSKRGVPIVKGNLIMVNLSTQTLYLYNKGECIFSADIISGRSGFDTPTGEYYINSKGTNVQLKGREQEEEWDTRVNFWMPFIGGAYGLHDATWQPEWKFQDPSAHYAGGSHGCINLRYGDAATLFSMIEVGTKIIIQY